MTYLMLGLGFVTILGCGDLLVRGAASLATRLGIPSLIVGLTIVAFGTSAPELVVSVEAAMRGLPGLAVGNIVGSNIANVLLVLGAPSIIYPVACRLPRIRRNFFFMLGATLIVMAMAYRGVIGITEGGILLALLAAFIGYSTYLGVRHSRALSREEKSAALEELSHLPQSMTWTVIFLVVGLVGLPVGAYLIIESGSEIARTFGVSDAIIGLSIVAIGTSLPELSATTLAAFRRENDVAVGNVIGSNIFNLLGILGTTSLISPLQIDASFVEFDLWIMLLSALLLIPFILGRRPINRFAGLLFTLLYAGYVYLLYQPDLLEQAGSILSNAP